jgi:hypothetical protein
MPDKAGFYRSMTAKITGMISQLETMTGLLCSAGPAWIASI